MIWPSPKEIRQESYEILMQNYPRKMRAAELARIISSRIGVKVSRRQVASALRKYALRNKHFSVFPINGKVCYSVYILAERYDA